jgi:hypothetical protein
MPPKIYTAGDRRPTFFARTFTELKVMFVRAVTVEQQKVLLQEGNRQCGDAQHMEGEVDRLWTDCRRQQWTLTQNQQTVLRVVAQPPIKNDKIFRKF